MQKALAGMGAVVSVLVATVLIAGCSSAKVVKQEAPLVRSQVIKVDGSGQGAVYSGEVRGRFESQLAFQVGGKIVRRNVDLGSAVAAGDVLMQIDARDVRQNVNSGEAERYAAESQLQLAANDLQRYQRLYEQGAVSKASYDSYVNSYHRAEALLRYASAQYSQGLNQLDYSDLTADAAGVVAGVSAEIGQVVSAGQPVLTVVQDGEREVEISVPENRIAQLRNTRQIQVSFWALPAQEVEGRVREVSPVADKVSRTFKVRISLINPSPEVKLGMTAAVSVAAAGGPGTAYVPLAAVYQTGDMPCVWVVDNGTAKLRQIKTGVWGDERVQVLEGLQDGETIVTAGVHKLQDGQQVRTTGDLR
ncbi:MAG: efflux RND transporter periplasmic adaptor subunit [Negativicutes bacterium]|nr:efflux RND transporter periplasmic adaptor subunit [Negativicutes bacterium]